MTIHTLHDMAYAYGVAEPVREMLFALQDRITELEAQRRPLTDEEILDEVKAADLDWQTGWSLDEDAANRYITFARSIEAAHGIKEGT